MMKHAFLSLVMIICCLTSPLLGQEVDISIDHPGQVNAGQEFTVTVTIEKGSLTDYSRFSQDLPLGLTATNVSSPNADFSFDNQRIRIIWLKLPDSDQVKVTYSIFVDERLKGTFILGGVFAYVVEDERKFLNFEQSREITIIPSSTIDPALIVDIKNFKGGTEVTPTSQSSEETYAMAVRQKPELLSTGGYLIHLLINNPPGSKYAKIEETIPSGYIFEEVSSQDGIVSYAASTAKFIWMKLPEMSEFEVVYRLVPRQNEPQGDMTIEGLLTYTSGNENRVAEIKEVDLSIEDLSRAQKRDLLQTGVVSGEVRRTEVTAQQQTPREETVRPRETETRTSTPAPPEPSLQLPPELSGTLGSTRMLSLGSGIVFRVQVAATQNAFDGRTFFRNEGVTEEVMVEEHEGMYKYTAGTFQTYDQAAAYRDQLDQYPSVMGPFVVAYVDGRRVPISSVVR